CSVSAAPGTADADRRERAGPPARAAPSCSLGLRGGEPSLLQQLTQRPLDARLALARRQLGGVRPCDDHEIVAVRQLVSRRPKSLAEQPLYAIALDRSANLAPNGNAEPRRGVTGLAGQAIDDQLAVRGRLPLPKHP